jgi:aryl-alcohol dehydrogenase-like predicted oxidoreductase
MPQLGFGTGSLYGGKDHGSSVALVRAAIDAGIRWIDTAPLYGHGAAEGIVGEAIRGQRDQLTLVSKVGVLPSRITLGYKVHARIAAVVGKLLGSRGGILSPPPPRRPRFNVFAPDEIRVSVERSLRTLGTDRLDFLLLHEVDPAVAADGKLRDVLSSLVAEGKVLALGTATQADKTAQIISSPGADLFALRQVPIDGALVPEWSCIRYSVSACGICSAGCKQKRPCGTPRGIWALIRTLPISRDGCWPLHCKSRG